MKKAILLFLVLSTALLLLLVSCSEAGSSDKENSNGGNTVTYTVTFDSRGGSDVSPQSVQSGGKATRPADPQRPGYSFVNWYSDAQFQTVYNFDQPVTSNITLYAQWIAAAVTYTVTFDSRGGSDVSPQSVQSGGKATRPADPQRPADPEYVFENWYSDATFQTVYNFDQPVTESITLYAQWIEAEKNLKRVVSVGIIPADLSEYDSLVQTVLAPYAANAAIVARYVDVTPRGTGDASSWENAAGDIKATVDGAGTDADTVYLVLLASGDYVPAITLGMKNNVAIVGGWNEWEQSGTSTISGEDTRRVFYNSGIDRIALLYGVTIANGNSPGGGSGGGMFNNNSSPTLINVTFVDNETSRRGGGMYNNSSSPTLINVTFSGNTASSGGGMNNSNSSPTLINVTFSGNTASSDGGGMFNQNNSSPVLSNVTFVNNKATNTGGGGMRNDNDGGEGPTIVNTLFWNNIGGASQVTAGEQIYMYNGGTEAENMTISFSLVQHGIEVTVGATSDDNAADGLGIDGGSASVTVTQAHNISGDPELAAALADNGGFVQTIALLDNSPAADAGAYVQRSGTAGSFTFYYSADNTNWFSDAVLSASASIDAAAIPAAALDLTATDARGYARNDRPDIGAYEYGGTAP